MPIAGSMPLTLSLVRRYPMVLQCTRPTVCAPERMTMSSSDSPFLAKNCTRMSTFRWFDGGRSPVKLARDTVPSGLPAGTAYPKSPLCVVVRIVEIKILSLQSVSSAQGMMRGKKNVGGRCTVLVTYQLDAVPGGERQDAGAGDGLLARRL
jgi:hypothetical protein